MRRICMLAALLVWATDSPGSETPANSWNWAPWERIAVEDGGRYKPLDTLARETLQAIADRETLVDPVSQKHLDPVAAYLTLLFDWQGWKETEGTRSAHGDASTDWYFAGHKADKWDRLPLLPVDDPLLRRRLGLSDGTSRISALELFSAVVTDDVSGDNVPFLLWADEISFRDAAESTELADTAKELVGRLNRYLALRMGSQLRVLPQADDPGQKWMSVRQLWMSEFDDQSDPTGSFTEAQSRLRGIRVAYQQRDQARFEELSLQLAQYLREIGPTCGPYADRHRIEAECQYNRWAPIRSALLMLCLASIVLVLTVRGGRILFSLGLTIFITGLLTLAAGLGVRSFIAQRPPVTNMYESVVFTSLAIGLLGLLIGARCASRRVVVTAAITTSVMLLLGHFSSTTTEHLLQPLPAALRSNFWLITHVLTVTLGYAAFGLALGIGNWTLGYFLFRPQNKESIRSLTNINGLCLRIGTTLLAIGTATGALWAESSWGRFWGWDPKEVWALITLFGYLAVLHAQHVRWVGDFGLAALSVICFALVVIAWYGVNFVLGAGLHSYGEGSGGEGTVLGLLFVQFSFVAVAAVRSAFSPVTADSLAENESH